MWRVSMIALIESVQFWEFLGQRTSVLSRAVRKGWNQAPPKHVRKYVGEMAFLPFWLPRGDMRCIWGFWWAQGWSMQARESTLDLKPKEDFIKSSKYSYQWLHKKDSNVLQVKKKVFSHIKLQASWWGLISDAQNVEFVCKLIHNLSANFAMSFFNHFRFLSLRKI